MTTEMKMMATRLTMHMMIVVGGFKLQVRAT